MEKPTETITNKIFNYFENNHKGKNWTLFLIILGLVHSAWWFGTFDFIKEFGTQNPYFIFLEILFIALGITRFLVAIDIFYIIAHFCLADDLLKIVWKKRRDEWREWKGFESPLRKDVMDLVERIYRRDGKYTRYDIEDIIMIARDRDGLKIPYHIQYWIKLEIKEYTPQKSFLDKTIIVGKKLIKYILSHVQKH